MDTRNTEQIAGRLSRLTYYLAFLTGLYFCFWLLAIIFALPLLILGAELLDPLHLVLIGSGQVLLIAALFKISSGIRRRSKIALLANSVVFSVFYLGIAGFVAYVGWQVPGFYAAQLATGANPKWLLVLIAVVCFLALALAGFVLRKWGGHAAATHWLWKTDDPLVTGGQPVGGPV